MRKKATSFFFTNFPDSWDSNALWKMFDRYGIMVDVYAAFKKSKLNTRFRFVRFMNVADCNSFEKTLKEIMIGDTKIIINMAKYIKVGGEGIPVESCPVKKPIPIPMGMESAKRRGPSCKDAMFEI
ncbi:nucleotide-binding alpha-beta plait domain-containing protein [Tanacetum coccineum]